MVYVMTESKFREILLGAVAGNHDNLEEILKLYEPLIHKHSHIDNKFDEDLYQYILIRIALNISKFSI